jgi:two-component system sensor histidine kinase CiaH
MSDPTTRLLARTRRQLFAVTLGLVALLVVGIGTATAFVTLRALDDGVDSALNASVVAAAETLHDGLPPGDEAEQADDLILDASDTFLLILDPSGAVVSNPSRVGIPPGLPDEAAVAAARRTGRDIRTVDAGGTPVRLLTVAITPESSGKEIGYVQGGSVLIVHDRQAQSIVAAIVLLGAVGLLGAAVVTLIVTGRALVPIRRSFDAQRRFVADASHELRTPAALIRANADVVEREGLVADDGRAFVTDIITEADRLGRLVGDLLQLETADATGVLVEPRPVDLAAIAVATVRQAEALAAERGVRLVVSPSSQDPAVVSGDRDRLVQLLLILFDNAFDHSPEAGTVTVDVHRSGHDVAVTVSDEGPGIPEPERERVFEPFTRLPGVRRDRAGGTGLGLAIARRIVDAHHGSIRIADAPGGGAAFVVAIPSSGGAPA